MTSKIPKPSDDLDSRPSRTTNNSKKAGVEQPLTTNSLKRIFEATAAGSKIPLTKELRKRIVLTEAQLEKAVSLERTSVPVSVTNPAEPAVNLIASQSVETNEQLEENTNKMVGSKTMVAPGTRDAPKFQAHKPEELRRFLRRMEDLAEAQRGTPQRLRQICSKTPEIALGDIQALYAFRRKFHTEAKKLLVEPAVMSNRELVDLFLERLADNMRTAVISLVKTN